MWTVDDGISAIREKGAKVTAQRIAILRNLEGRTDHPSIEMIYNDLAEDYPTMSIATVYSTIHLLAEASLIKILSIDDKKVYCDPNTNTHGHFLCTQCNKVSDFGLDEAELIKLGTVSNDNMGHIEHAEVFFYGLCTACV